MFKMAFELSFRPVRKWSLNNNIYKGQFIVPFLYYLYYVYISTFLFIHVHVLYITLLFSKYLCFWMFFI